MCFATTVLPSSKPLCYLFRFAKDHQNSREPPADWYHWMKMGLKIRGEGGCNDLLFSGHCVICIACIMPFRDHYSGSWINFVLWCSTAHAALESIVPKQHYSMDYLVGVPITILIWDTIAKRLTDEARQFTVDEVEDALERGEGLPTSAMLAFIPVTILVYAAVALIGS